MKNLLKIVRSVFVPEKDYAGRNISCVIHRLSLQTNTSKDEWSYIQENNMYENTVTGMKVYPHEVSRS